MCCFCCGDDKTRETHEVIYEENSETFLTENKVRTKKMDKKMCLYSDFSLPSRGYRGCSLQDHRCHGEGSCCHNYG